MSLVSWNNAERKPVYVQLLVLWAIAFFLFYFFGGLRLIASVWAPSSDEVIAWWPKFGWASMTAMVVAFFSPCILPYLQRRILGPVGMGRIGLSAVMMVSVISMVSDARARVAVGASEVSLYDVAGTARSYPLTDIDRLEVSCLNGRRGGAEPGLIFVAADGAEIDLGDMFALAWNGPPKSAWLTAAESITAAALRSGVWKVSVNPRGQPNFDRGCIQSFADRFSPTDRERVVALFLPLRT